MSPGALGGHALLSLCYPVTHPGEDGAYADGEESLLGTATPASEEKAARGVFCWVLSAQQCKTQGVKLSHSELMQLRQQDFVVQTNLSGSSSC